MRDRKNLVIMESEDSDYVLTIMKPMSTEHSGKLIVLYEDAFGDVNMNIMLPKGIVANYNVDIEKLEEFTNHKDDVEEEKE